MLRQRSLGLVTAFVLSLLLTHCAAFSPDRYQGDGSWIRYDGTTYVGPPSIAVTGIEVLHSNINRDRYIENVESQNEQGQTVIREVVTTTMRVNADLLVFLEDGSQHKIVIQAEGPENVTRVMSVSFTAPNGKVYRAVSSIRLDERRPSVKIRVSAPGPVSYSTTLYLE